MTVAVDWNGTDVGPATHAEAVTPSDANDLVRVSRALYVGGAGDVAIVTRDGSGVILSAVPAGTVLPVRVTRVKSTGTTATLLVALA